MHLLPDHMSVFNYSITHRMGGRGLGVQVRSTSIPTRKSNHPAYLLRIYRFLGGKKYFCAPYFLQHTFTVTLLQVVKKKKIYFYPKASFIRSDIPIYNIQKYKYILQKKNISVQLHRTPILTSAKRLLVCLHYACVSQNHTHTHKKRNKIRKKKLQNT